MVEESKGSLSDRAGELLFKGVLYILYGRRVGETEGEKAARVSLVIVILVIFFLALSALISLVGEHLFVEKVAPVPIEWGAPIKPEILPGEEMFPEMYPEPKAPLP